MTHGMSEESILEFIKFTRKIYGDGDIPLHRPIFENNAIEYLIDCINSNFVSTAGKKVSEFEERISRFVGSKYAVATINGTSALHVALKILAVQNDDEVITQALTFIGTCNPIVYVGARPIFVDVDLDTLGLSPNALRRFLEKNGVIKKGQCWNKYTGRRIAACIPMHTFGIPCRINEITVICKEWNIPIIEDSAESLGSYFQEKHTGTFGLFGILSFNGNKIITTGGGGMIITDNENLAKRAKHITKTSKIAHQYEINHDEVGYNYGLPNLNAALGCAQIENLESMLAVKQKIHLLYVELFKKMNVSMVKPLQISRGNNWLNAIILQDKKERDMFLTYTNDRGITTRPVWRLISETEMYKKYQRDDLENSYWLQDRIVNIPSSVPDTLF